MKKRFLLIILVLCVLVISGCEEVRKSPSNIKETTIYVKDSFKEGETISFDYSIYAEEDVSLVYLAHVECPNAPVALLDYKNLELKKDELSANTYTDFKINSEIEPQTCIAYLEIMEPYHKKIEKEFKIITDPSFYIDINLCKDEECSKKTKVFLKDEELFIQSLSDVENPEKIITIIKPSGFNVNSEKLVLDEVGQYSILVTALKQGYKDYSEKIDFVVIEESPSINEKTFVKSSGGRGNEKNINQYENKELFLISSENWQDVLGLVPVTTWTEGSEVIKYPSLIYYEENLEELQIGISYGNPTGMNNEYIPYYPRYFLYYKRESDYGAEWINGEIFSEEFCNSEDSEGLLPVGLSINKEFISYGESAQLLVRFKNCGGSGDTLEWVKLEDWPYSGFISLDEYLLEPNEELEPGEEIILEFNLTSETLMESSWDLDSNIYFIQQYSPNRVTVVGEATQEIINLLTADRPFGAGLNPNQIQTINPTQYTSYWDNYYDVVLVDDNYELALIASTYASLKNAPLVLDEQNFDFTDKHITIIGNLDCPQEASDCIFYETKEDLQQEYLALTNTNKIILTNYNDLNIVSPENFLPEKSASMIYELYSKNSLAAPFLASAKHELILNTNSIGWESVDNFIDTSILNLDFSPEYLTIIASPNAIEMSYEKIYPWGGKNNFHSVDAWQYSNINDGDLFLDLAVGRIFGLTISDTSSNIARSLFYEETTINTNDLLVTRGSPASTMAAEVYTMGKVLEYIGYNALITPEETNPPDWKNKFFISYNDHGGPSWAGISSSEIPSLDNSFITTMACATCAFKKAIYKNDLFCSNAIRKGAVGYIGAVDNTGTWGQGDLLTELFGKEDTIGKSFLNAKNYAFLFNSPPFNPDFFPMGEYTLIGDPTLKIETIHTFPKPTIEILEQNEDHIRLDLTVQAMKFEIPEWVRDLCEYPSQVEPLFFTTALHRQLNIDWTFTSNFETDDFDPDWVSSDGWFANKEIINNNNYYWITAPELDWGETYFEGANEEEFKEFNFDFELSKPPASLTGEYFDYGLDSDGDGEYNSLMIEVNVSVTQPGYYYLQGNLETLNGTWAGWGSHWNNNYLYEGINTLTLEFDGTIIYLTEEEGPYLLKIITLQNENYQTLDYEYYSYETQNYSFLDFDPLKSQIVEDTFNDYGVDTNYDGDYEYLIVEYDLEVFEQSSFEVRSNLQDLEGGVISSFNEIYPDLTLGVHSMQLVFPGQDIYNYGESEIYWGGLNIYDESSEIDYSAYETNYYDYEQFNPIGQPCSADWTTCGETFSPDCTALSQTVCCGDDEDETYQYMKDVNGETCDDINDKDCVGGSNENDNACCDNLEDCVYNGVCYSKCGAGSCELTDADEDGVLGAFCMNDGSGQWKDCDVGPSLCESNSYCGYTGAYTNPGEANVGEYGANLNAECCGDDQGEFLISGNGFTRCCDHPNDKINSNGNCITQGKPRPASAIQKPMRSPEQGKNILILILDSVKKAFGNLF